MLRADAEMTSVILLDHEKNDKILGNLSGNSVHLASCIYIMSVKAFFLLPYGHEVTYKTHKLLHICRKGKQLTSIEEVKNALRKNSSELTCKQ